MKGKILFAILLLPIALHLSSKLVAAEGVEVTNYFQIDDQAAVDGDVLSNNRGRIVRSAASLDFNMFGVLTDKPIIGYRDNEGNRKAVARGGVTEVNVTNLNGRIAKGDFITSSEIAGKGGKAVSSGYVLGVALADFNGDQGQTVNFRGRQYRQGRIAVAVRIEYVEITTARSLSRLFALFSSIFFRDIRDTGQANQFLKNLVAALIILLALVVAILTLTRSIPKAIEAIGRNPLARTAIYVSMAVNVIAVILILGVAVLAATLILRLQ